MNILLLICSLYSILSHDIQVAIFKITQEKKIVHIDFIFEKDDMLLSLKKSETMINEEQLQNYVQNHFSFEINNNIQVLSYSRFNIDDKHILLRGSVLNAIQQIQSIKIYNTCLLDIEDHSNIIEIRVHDQERDYLMNSDRTTIEVDFKL